MAIAQDAAPIPRGPFSSAAPALGLSGLFDILLRQVWVILAVFAAVLALAVVFLLTSTPKYTAAVELLLDPRDQRILPNEITQPGAGSDAALVESQLTVLTSDAVLGRTVDQLDLSANEEWVRGADIASFEATNASRGLERAAISRLIAIDALRRAVTVRRAERTYVIEVRVTSKDATLARAIADAIAGNYVTDQTDALKQRNMQTNQAVTARLDTLRADLKRAEEKLQAFRESNDLVGAQGTVIIDQQLQELTVRLTQAQARTAEASSRATRLAAIARAGGIENTPDALTSQVLIALKGQLADARRRVAELYPTLGDNHPTLIEARSQAAQINALIHKEAERIAAAAKAEADVARAQEAALTRELEEAKKKGQGVDAALIGQRDLERNVQAARQVYEALLNRAKETREQSEIETSSARVLAPAALLSRSPSPSRTLILALGIIGGLGLGTILALLRAHAANAVTGPQHLRDLTGVSVMTVNTGRLTGRSIFGKPTTQALRPAVETELGLVAQSLRMELRDTPQRRSERVLLCAGIDNSEDSAALALKVAQAVAVAGERVLLIDADPVTSAITRSLGLEQRKGLRDVLNGSNPLNETAVADKERMITVLPHGGGGAPLTTAESAKLREVLSSGVAQFGYVILAMPAVSRDATTLQIAASAEQILLTAQAFKTKAQSVQRVMQLLGTSASKLRRIVLLTEPRPSFF